MFKQSFYNHLINLEDGQFLLFNARTLAMVIVDKEQYSEIIKVFNSLDTFEADNQLIDSLSYGGFLVPKHFDEKKSISNALWSARKNKKYCSITIAPTMGCNFNCNYCFEEEIVRANYDIMSNEVQDEIIKFLGNHFDKFSTEFVSLTWFGGEPLLALPVIERFSKFLIEICKNKNIQFNADIITNGYKIDEPTAIILKEAGISAAQITIDGPEIIHDSRRILKSGKSTFKTILRNINVASKYIDINLRVNIDRQNYKLANNLINEVDSILDKNKVSFTLGYVVDKPNVEPKYGVSISRENFSNVDLDFAKNAKEFDFKVNNSPKLINNACGADHEFSLMLGPKGEIYQCWEDFGNPDYVVGNVLEGRDFSKSNYVNNYMDFDPTKDIKCSNCTVMPLCMGGCPKQRLLHGEPQCGIYKFNLKERLVDEYKNKFSSYV